jgi:hypothetical protein
MTALNYASLCLRLNQRGTRPLADRFQSEGIGLRQRKAMEP